MHFGSEKTNYFDFHHTPNDTLDKVNMPAITHNAAIYAMFAYMAIGFFFNLFGDANNITIDFYDLDHFDGLMNQLGVGSSDEL